MLLGEPPRTQADLNFQLFGIPVRVHPFFWLVIVILGAGSPDLRALLIWVAAALISILFHELGHAAAMRAYGLYPWITLYGLGGLTLHNQAQGYGSRRFGPLGRILITAAGPVAGFLLAAIVIASIRLSGNRISLEFGGWQVIAIRMGQVGSLGLSMFFWDLLQTSIWWGILNLLPIQPLDGGQIAREILLLVSPRSGMRRSLVLSAVTATILAAISLVSWGSFYAALFFGYLAFASYAALHASGGRWPW